MHPPPCILMSSPARRRRAGPLARSTAAAARGKREKALTDRIFFWSAPGLSISLHTKGGRAPKRDRGDAGNRWSEAPSSPYFPPCWFKCHWPKGTYGATFFSVWVDVVAGSLVNWRCWQTNTNMKVSWQTTNRSPQKRKKKIHILSEINAMTGSEWQTVCHLWWYCSLSSNLNVSMCLFLTRENQIRCCSQDSPPPLLSLILGQAACISCGFSECVQLLLSSSGLITLLKGGA